MKRRDILECIGWSMVSLATLSGIIAILIEAYSWGTLLRELIFLALTIVFIGAMITHIRKTHL